MTFEVVHLISQPGGLALEATLILQTVTTSYVASWRVIFYNTRPCKHDTLTQAWLMLGQRRRRCPNISLALGQCIVFFWVGLKRVRGSMLEIDKEENEHKCFPVVAQ